jgi:hypothetical protein
VPDDRGQPEEAGDGPAELRAPLVDPKAGTRGAGGAGSPAACALGFSWNPVGRGRRGWA